jgi:phospholipase D-like protein
MVVQGENTASAHVETESARPRWTDLPGWQQTGIVALAAVEIVLTTVAVADLVRRPRRQVRGPKALWAVGFGVQPFGPLTYLLAGRRR